MFSLQKSQSIGEFIRFLEFKRHTEFVLAFGYYLEKKEGRNDFAAADINKCYYEAKMESSNTSQMIVQNIKAGRIMISKKHEGKKETYFTLTQTGIEYIEKRLNVNKS
jgi:predicted transcriptional regulator